MQFRCADGRTSDVVTHEETWDSLCPVTGRPGFLYVADGKRCHEDALTHIDRRRGRFLTVLPRTRLEDREFREWIQTHEPPWEIVRDEENGRRKDGPQDRWRAFRYLSLLKTRSGMHAWYSRAVPAPSPAGFSAFPGPAGIGPTLRSTCVGRARPDDGGDNSRLSGASGAEGGSRGAAFVVVVQTAEVCDGDDRAAVAA